MKSNYCDCNQGRTPCTCKMAPKLADAVKRFGSPLDDLKFPKRVYGREVPRGLKYISDLTGVTPDMIIHDEVNQCENGCHASDVYFGSWKRTEAERDALQELLTQRDMEIDYLATARPTVLRLDWYAIALATLANIALHYAFI